MTKNRTKWRTGNDTDDENEAAGNLAVVYNHDVSIVDESKALDADINEVLRRFGVTDGSLPPAAINWQDLDLTNAPESFSDAMHTVHNGREAFMRLPADMRANFNNDPAQLMDFIHDPRNYDKAIEMGFLQRPPAEPAPSGDPAEGGGTAA